MEIRCFMAALVVVLTCACGPEPDPHRLLPRNTSTSVERAQPIARVATLAYGWETAISAESFGPRAEVRNGEANTTLAGHALHEIVSDPTVAVRADGHPCATCHTWAENETKQGFCDRVPMFLALPTATGSAEDPASAKPAVLKDLLQHWKEAGCPD